MHKRLLKSGESLVAILLLFIVVVFSIASPSFRSLPTLFNILRASIVSGIVALASLIVFVSGGVDMSFMSIASVSMYVSVTILSKMDSPSIVLAFLIGGIVGILLGLVNAFFVTKTHISIFIVTLATHFIYKGACLAFVGTEVLQVPESMIWLSKTNLFTATMQDGSVTGLNISIVLVVALYILVHLFLRYTKFGRKLYAIGGDSVAAQRSGINVPMMMTLMFAVSGFIASIAGVINASLLRLASPGDMIGNELPILASVILGGANAAKGKGTVLGTALGVLLIALISNSLTVLKIPSFWQEAVLGAIIIFGTIIQSRSDKAE